MITEVLLEHPWLSPTVLALMVMLGPFLGGWLVSRSQLAWVFTGVSLVPVAMLTLWPVDREVFARCTVQWSVPMPGRVELFANVVLFVGPVLLAGVATRRPVLVFVAAGTVSAGLEAFQAFLPAVGRSCDTNDWLCNTIGAGLGAVLAVVSICLARNAAVPRSAATMKNL